MEGQLADAADRGDPVAVDADGPGQDDDIGDLAYLGGLDIKGQEGEGQPGAVAGVALNAEDQKQADKDGVEQEQQGALTGQNVDVKGRESKKNDDAGHQTAALDNDVAGVVLGGGGGIDHDDAEQRCHDAQCQQEHIALFRDLYDLRRQLLHSLTSRRQLSNSYFITLPR